MPAARPANWAEVRVKEELAAGMLTPATFTPTGATPKKTFPVTAEVGVVDRVTCWASTMEATVVPGRMPVPATGSPTNMPRLLSTETVLLLVLVVVNCEAAAGAVKLMVVGVPAVAAAERVTSPVL